MDIFCLVMIFFTGGDNECVELRCVVGVFSAVEGGEFLVGCVELMYI